MTTNAPTASDNSMRPQLVEKELSYTIVGAFFEVYNALGYGFLESIYSRAMEVALSRRGIKVRREVPITVRFRGIEVGRQRLDMLVEDRIILENKSTERLSDIPKRQLQNYLTASGLPLGLLLHFGPRATCYRVLGRKSSAR